MEKENNMLEERLKQGYYIVARHNYTDEEGNVVYQVIRLYNPVLDKRKFAHIVASGKGLRETQRVLYNLPAVIRADRVFIVEGEKDADTLINLGLCATTNDSGSCAWDESFNKYLAGKDVYILGDNDKPGQKYLEMVKQHLINVARSLVTLTPSSLPKGDVTDYLTIEGGTLDSLFLKIRTEGVRE